MDASVPQGTGNPGVIFCPNCGQQNPQSNRFCGQCGNPLPSTCPSCGAANPAGNRFCSACGSAFSAPVPSSIDTSTSPQPSIPSGSAGSALVERERRLVTVLFCDLVGFTPLSERLDPEDVREIQTMYFGRMSKEIRTFGGTVEKYIGDAVLAMFGVPVAHEDDAVRAIRCGLSMQEAITSIAVDVAKRWGVELALRVGVNTGEVVSGKWEVAGRKEYDVSGDAVNTAARLQTAAAPGEVLVGEETMWLARKAIRFSERREVTLKGKSGVVPVYSAVELVEEPTRRWERGPRTELVGRSDELALLKSIWAKVVREKRPHFVTVLGEPGIGKSRLVAEFEGSVLNEALMLHGRCLPYGEVLGYWALAEVLKEATGIATTDDTDTAYRKLGDLVARVIGQTEAAWDPLEITRHLALLSGLEVDIDQSAAPADQPALHVSVRRFIEVLARSQPLCIILEDLHWADDALLDLIEFIAARVHDVPLLIVVQARPELLEKRPAWGRGVRGFTSLSLEPLDDQHTHELGLQLCWKHGLPEEVAAQIDRGAAGNPLFVEELAATIAERGKTTGVPSAIKALISARLDALLPGERKVIQLASVIGKVFWEGGLRALGASGGVNTHLEALEQKDLLRIQTRSQFRGDQEYAFKHDLIRDVAYEMLSRADRRLLHGRVATWLEAIGGERIEEYLDLLAHHAVQADQPERAIEYLTRAAERANRAAAHRQEAALLAQAIDIAERTCQQQLIAELHAKCGKAFSAVAMWAEADRELKNALSGLAPEQHEQCFQVLIDLAEVSYWLLDTFNSRQYATEALRRAEQAGRDDLAAAAMCALANADNSEGAVQASLNHYQHAFARAGKNFLPPRWFEQYGLTLYWTGNYEAAIESSRKALDGARKSHDTNTINMALGDLGLILTGKGRYDEALQVFAEARQVAHEYGNETWLARSTAMCGGLHLEVFDFAGAQALAEEAREISRSVNFPRVAASAGIDLLLNYARSQQVGRTKPLLSEVAEATMKAQGAHGWIWKLRLAQARAEIALACGEWEQAVGFAGDAIAQSLLCGRVKYQAAGQVTRAQALAALGRKHEAIAGLRSAIELARPVGDPAMFLRAAASLLVLDGDDALLAEARSTARRIIGALPDEEMIRCFTVAEPVRVLGTLTP